MLSVPVQVMVENERPLIIMGPNTLKNYTNM